MKNYLTLLLLTTLWACNGPIKLFEKGQESEAYIKLLEKNKLNIDEKALLIQLHAGRIAHDEKIINQWMLSDSLEIWPRISGRLERIAFIQNEINQVALQQEIPIAQFAAFSNLNEKSSLAKERAAEYYYLRHKEEYALALSGNKKAARRGYELGKRTTKYIKNYKDVQETNTILKDLGTDYIVMIYDSSYLETPEIISLEAMVNSWTFPESQFWSELTTDPSTFERVDYWLNVAPFQADISPPLWSEDRCSNSVEVQIGCKTVQEWSEADSSFVQKEIPIMQTVSVEVVNYEQIRTGNLAFEIQLFQNGRKDLIAKTEQSVRFSWSNDFGEQFGDQRAVGLGCCPDSGCEAAFPSESAILANMGTNMKRPIKVFLDSQLDSYEK